MLFQESREDPLGARVMLQSTWEHLVCVTNQMKSDFEDGRVAKMKRKLLNIDKDSSVDRITNLYSNWKDPWCTGPDRETKIQLPSEIDTKMIMALLALSSSATTSRSGVEAHKSFLPKPVVFYRNRFFKRKGVSVADSFLASYKQDDFLTIAAMVIRCCLMSHFELDKSNVIGKSPGVQRAFGYNSALNDDIVFSSNTIGHNIFSTRNTRNWSSSPLGYDFPVCHGERTNVVHSGSGNVPRKPQTQVDFATPFGSSKFISRHKPRRDNGHPFRK
ncbi:hypothetical protein POM88_036170 [Heracleum sosnowskyi]|uniref:Uncharacterized protein n=1 Tax=Heracleum sosnowskyi TaxID=360622 RepID=A0AAD8HMU7_9APIA|nr:hypothetical protein POM88_036166 [Heracleum sosnowskyi]KAK1370078.1 hypothetical protein POM88_036170 [Heracleum sosnowskyi]